VITIKHLLLVGVTAFAVTSAAYASPPHQCIRDDTNGRARITHSCNVKCLFVELPYTPLDRDVKTDDEMDDLPANQYF